MNRILFLGLCALTRLSALEGCGDFDATIDYLLWKPANFAVHFNDSTATKGDRQYLNDFILDPPYSSGVRGELRWHPDCGCMDLIGRYSWVESTQRKTFFEGNDVNPNRAQFIYHGAELFASYRFHCSSCLKLESLIGGRIVYTALNTEERDQNIPDGSVNFIDRAHVRIAGGGASAGLAATWNVGRCMEVFAEGHLGLIFASNMQAGELVSFGNEATTYVPYSFQTWTRELDFRLGGRYSMSYGCTAISLQLGWEARAYLDFPDWQAFGRGENARIIAQARDYGKAVGGPFAGVSVRF